MLGAVHVRFGLVHEYVEDLEWVGRGYPLDKIENALYRALSMALVANVMALFASGVCKLLFAADCTWHFPGLLVIL